MTKQHTPLLYNSILNIYSEMAIICFANHDVQMSVENIQQKGHRYIS